MKINIFVCSLFFAYLPFTLKPAAQPLESTAKLPASYGSMLPRQHSFGSAPQPIQTATGSVTLPRQHSFGSARPASPAHPVLLGLAIPGRPYSAASRPESMEINSDTNETGFEITFKKLEFQHIVKKIGEIHDSTQSAQIIDMLQKCPRLQALTPYIIEISNSDNTTIQYDYNRFCFDYRDLLENVNLSDTLKFQWRQVWYNACKFILNVTGIAAVIGVDAIFLQLAANRDCDESASDESYITAFKQALGNILVHLASLGSASFFVKNIAQRWSLIKARTQVQNEVEKYEVPYEIPQDGLSFGEIPFLVEGGSTKEFLVLVKTVQCHAFEHQISTKTLNEYVAPYIEDPIEEGV